MNFTAKRMLRRTAMRPRPQGFKKKARASTTPAIHLAQDVLASILVRLPGSDLRRLRRVCKEWRDVISDPTFIHEHMVYEPKSPPSDTIVFFPGFTYGSRQYPRNGRGFLFDEHWRLKAELTAGRWDDLIGACNGLLCFLEAGQGSIKIVEPFTNESLAVPLPPQASGALRWTINPGAYCFGFDAATRKYKIVHHNFLKYNDHPQEEELHVYTVGGGKCWRRVDVAHSVHGQAYGKPLYIDRLVYWPSRSYVNYRRDEKLVCFDPATEKITSETTVRLQQNPTTRERALFCRLVDSTPPCVITYGSSFEWDGWFPESEEGGAAHLPGGRVLLCMGEHGRLYICRIERNLEVGQRIVLFQLGTEPEQPPGYKFYNGPASFVPARIDQQLPVPGAPPSREQCYARTFAYAPTVSAAPLTLYLG